MGGEGRKVELDGQVMRRGKLWAWQPLALQQSRHTPIRTSSVHVSFTKMLTTLQPWASLTVCMSSLACGMSGKALELRWGRGAGRHAAVLYSRYFEKGHWPGWLARLHRDQGQAGALLLIAACPHDAETVVCWGMGCAHPPR